MHLNCPSVSLTKSFCTNGTNTNVTFIEGYIQFSFKPTAASKVGPGFPDIYNHTSVINLQGSLTTALMKNPAVSSQIMLPAINIQITNYSYYSSTGTLLTPTTGIAPSNKSDYLDAGMAKYWFNVAQVYSNEQLALKNQLWINNANFKNVLAAIYGVPPTTLIIYATTSTPIVYNEQPFNTMHSSATNNYIQSITLTMKIILFITTYFLITFI